MSLDGLRQGVELAAEKVVRTRHARVLDADAALRLKACGQPVHVFARHVLVVAAVDDEAR